MKNLSTLILLLVASSAFAQTQIDFYTTMGDFRVEVREDLMPITAGNFIDLVEAEFYDGIIFHRVIAGFVIQGGDPTGTGFGGPGYTIMDEYHPEMNHDSTGVIAMAKTSAPNSAGSQFYFTLGAQNGLDMTYAVFGTCIENVEVIEQIGLVATNGNDAPLVDVVMDSLRIVEAPSGLIDFKPSIRLETYPNPFSESTQISYEVITPGTTQLMIYDIQGRLINSWTERVSNPGIKSIVWRGEDADFAEVPNGTYYFVLTTPDGVGTQKLIKIR
jgi:peptidyl-prolyl cis-trans isomerase A (cyclophilin A)